VNEPSVLPAGFHNWNRALQGAYLKGWRAAQAGESATTCPYWDKRKKDGRLTWARSFLLAWQDGHSDYHNPGEE